MIIDQRKSHGDECPMVLGIQGILLRLSVVPRYESRTCGEVYFVVPCSSSKGLLNRPAIVDLVIASHLSFGSPRRPECVINEVI